MLAGLENAAEHLLKITKAVLSGLTEVALFIPVAIGAYDKYQKWAAKREAKRKQKES